MLFWKIYFRTFGPVVFASVVLHCCGFWSLGSTAGLRLKAATPVKVTIKTAEEPPPPAPPEPPPPKPKEKKPKSLPKPEKKEKAPEPVLGLNKDSLALGAGTMAAPVGNTMMAEDEGKRINPDDLAGDLSSDARLVAGSVAIPPYTEEALDAALEGSYIVDVYVDETGKVTQADLRKKIGYGMDERIIRSALGARFQPRLDKVGRKIAGWTEIKFTLIIP